MKNKLILIPLSISTLLAWMVFIADKNWTSTENYILAIIAGLYILLVLLSLYIYFKSTINQFRNKINSNLYYSFNIFVIIILLLFIAYLIYLGINIYYQSQTYTGLLFILTNIKSLLLQLQLFLYLLSFIIIIDYPLFKITKKRAN